MSTRPRDEEAAALRPTLLLALIVSVMVAFVVFWPRKQPIEISTPAKAPGPVAANTTASAPIVAPPIEEITDEVIVVVPAPHALTTTSARAAAPSAMASASASNNAPLANGPISLPVAPILSVEHVQPRNTEQDKGEPAHVTNKEWSCPRPPGTEKITLMKVHVKVSVSWEGRATGVEVLDDPGSGFGEYAKKCALEQTYTPARDAKGQPTSGSTGAIAVYFH